MSRMKKILSLLFCLGFLSFGCGSDDDEAATPAAAAAVYCDPEDGSTTTCMQTIGSCPTGTAGNNWKTRTTACPTAGLKGSCKTTSVLGDVVTNFYDENLASAFKDSCTSPSVWTDA